MAILVVCALVPILIFGPQAVLLGIAILFVYGYVLLLVNFCLILLAKGNWYFKFANLGIFVVYCSPVVSSFSDEIFLSEYLSHFIVLVPFVAIAHFLYLKIAGRLPEPYWLWKILKFSVALYLMVIACTIVWDNVVMENLYNDTDENMFGFSFPGDWVSNWDGQHPIVAVDHIVHGGDMSAPDTIKKGWTVGGLWCLWFSFVGIALMGSFGLAWLPWWPKQRNAVTTTSS